MPALLKIKRNIENYVWRTNFSLDAATLPEADKELMRKFGEPTIEVGGTFTPSVGAAYALPAKQIRLRSDLPYTQEFDSKSPDFLNNVQEKAQAFEQAFTSRYTAALLALRSRADTFTGESIVTI